MTKPIALALSGSGYLATVHVGALTAVLEFGFTPTDIDCTSGGSVVASIYAAGMSIEAMKDLALNADFSTFFRFTLMSAIRHAAYCDGDNLLSWLEQNTNNKSFSDVGVNIKMIATDLVSGSKVALSKQFCPNMSLALAARSSAAIPYLYSGVQYGGMYLTDGGTTANLDMSDLPVSGIPKLGVELIRTVNKMPIMDFSAIAIAKRLIEIMMGASEASQVRIGQLENAQIATVDVTGFDMMNTSMTYSDRLTLFQRGYDAAAEALKKL